MSLSYVIADPEIMTAAASDLARIGSDVSAAHIAATAPTVAVIPAAADEVSADIAHLFSGYGQQYQALAGQAAAFHEQFVQHLTAGAFSYASIEAAIASFLQDLNVNADILISLALDATQLIVGILSVSALAVIGAIIGAVIVAVLLAGYIATALQHLLMTGPFLSFTAFLSGLFANLPPLFPRGYPVF